MADMVLIQNDVQGNRTFVSANEVIANSNIEIARQNKIKELDENCNKQILLGFDSNAKDGVTIKHYSYSYDDQINMSAIINKILKAIVSNGSFTGIIEWKNAEQYIYDNDWTVDQFTNLYDNAETFKNNLINKNHSLKQNVVNATTIEEINSIVF